MLPRASRLTRTREFRLVVRRGRRTGRSRLVVHVLSAKAAGGPNAPVSGYAECPHERRPDECGAPRSETAPTRRSRVGFVVSKAVGTAVVRHRVARQLRHLMRPRLTRLPAGTLVVVRALPRAASARSDELAADLDAAMRKLGVLDAPVPDDPRVPHDDRELHGRSR